jgi:Transposase DDE domain group 1
LSRDYLGCDVLKPRLGRITLKVQRDGRNVTVEVTSDGEGLVSHAGSALLAQIADKSGLTQALSVRLAGLKQRRSGHDPGRVVRDLAVMLADGGDCLADIVALRDQDALFGAVASDLTAFRVIDAIASTPGLLDALADAHAWAREHVWKLAGAPERVTIEVDATLIASHSEKEGAAGTFKGGYGFHPLMAYCDETSDALAAILRPGNAGSNTAGDHVAVIQDALAQVPAELIETIEILVRTDSAGATHEVMDFCREHRLCYTAGYELTDPVRAAIIKIPETAWVSALATGGSERENGQIAEITDLLDLTAWPTGSRVIVRRERAHPGAQLSFTDHDGHRFQAVLTDQSDPDIQVLERRQRQRAHAETHIRNDKDTGLRNMPFRDFEHNRVWLMLVGIAHDLIAWTQRLLLTGELARCEPKRLRYRLLHVAARLAFHARTATLRIHAAWPWVDTLVAAFTRARALPTPA